MYDGFFEFFESFVEDFGVVDVWYFFEEVNLVEDGCFDGYVVVVFEVVFGYGLFEDLLSFGVIVVRVVFELV